MEILKTRQMMSWQFLLLPIGDKNCLKKETHKAALKIARPVIRQVTEANASTYGSDCPMAGRLIQHGKNDGSQSEHPITMLSRAYGLG